MTNMLGAGGGLLGLLRTAAKIAKIMWQPNSQLQQRVRVAVHALLCYASCLQRMHVWRLLHVLQHGNLVVRCVACLLRARPPGACCLSLFLSAALSSLPVA